MFDGYDGLRDDDVRVGLLVSEGIRAELPDGGVSATASVPTWRGEDRWTANASYLTDPVRFAPAAITKGWAHDGVLVAKFGTLGHLLFCDYLDVRSRCP